MLTARGIDPLKPMGGIPEITQADVATCLRACDKAETALIMAKYAGGDKSSFRPYWLRHVFSQPWFLSDEVIERIADLALEEHLTGLICKACGGVGAVKNDALSVVCESCQGLGRKHWSGRSMAKHVGVSRLNQKQNDLLEWCRRHLRLWEMRAVSKMKD